MYKKIKANETSMKVNNSYEGETIENKVRRITSNKEPISDGAPLVYTKREDGIRPEHDIRTDRWEIAADAMDYVAKSRKAKREERHKKKDIGEEAVDNMKKEGQNPPANNSEGGA